MKELREMIQASSSFGFFTANGSPLIPGDVISEASVASEMVRPAGKLTSPLEVTRRV